MSDMRCDNHDHDFIIIHRRSHHHHHHHHCHYHHHHHHRQNHLFLLVKREIGESWSWSLSGLKFMASTSHAETRIMYVHNKYLNNNGAIHLLEWKDNTHAIRLFSCYRISKALATSRKVFSLALFVKTMHNFIFYVRILASRVTHGIKRYTMKSCETLYSYWIKLLLLL